MSLILLLPVVKNAQRRDLVILYGTQRYIRLIIIINIPTGLKSYILVTCENGIGTNMPISLVVINNKHPTPPPPPPAHEDVTGEPPTLP